MKDVFSERELVDLEYFIQDMAIKTGDDSHSFAVTNGCATYYLYLDGFEQRTCLFKPSYFGRNPKGNWIAVDFVIGKNGNCVLGSVRNIDPSVAKNSSNYSDFYKGYVGKYWRFDVPHDFFDYMNESKKSARKSLKEDSLDDIIRIGHSEYFDTLIEFLKDEDVPIRISHTASGGKICYVENDMEFITVIFKSPKHGYELLKMIEMYGDGSTYLSRGKGGAWYSNHVPLEEVYVWDINKDEFINYKGKVLKNIDYDDIVESKTSARKAIKEQFVGKGEGGYRKPNKTKFNSGICLDSNGVKHTVIFDTRVEDFIVWVDNDNYLMWYVSSPQSLLNNLSESDLDENLILDIVALWEKLPKKYIKN